MGGEGRVELVPGTELADNVAPRESNFCALDESDCCDDFHAFSIRLFPYDVIGIFHCVPFVFSMCSNSAQATVYSS
jgi:hypothetical protein